MNAAHLLSLCLAGTAILPAADYRLTGPHTVDHATVYLVYPAQPKTVVPGRNYLPLKEALAQRKVAVYETGNVNELAIENLSQDTDVFIHSGDIVKGGQQDRVFSTDLILPPRSGRTPVESFCVEQGRWSRRGREDGKRFSASDNAIVSKEAKLAIKGSKNQSEVWKSVAGMQDKLRSATSLGAGLAGSSPEVTGEQYARMAKKTAWHAKAVRMFKVLGGGCMSSAKCTRERSCGVG